MFVATIYIDEAKKAFDAGLIGNDKGGLWSKYFDRTVQVGPRAADYFVQYQFGRLTRAHKIWVSENLPAQRRVANLGTVIEYQTFPTNIQPREDIIRCAIFARLCDIDDRCGRRRNIQLGFGV